MQRHGAAQFRGVGASEPAFCVRVGFVARPSDSVVLQRLCELQLQVAMASLPGAC